MVASCLPGVLLSTINKKKKTLTPIASCVHILLLHPFLFFFHLTSAIVSILLGIASLYLIVLFAHPFTAHCFHFTSAITSLYLIFFFAHHFTVTAYCFHFTLTIALYSCLHILLLHLLFPILRLFKSLKTKNMLFVYLHPFTLNSLQPFCPDSSSSSYKLASHP